ncbi:MAG TPA: 16S rRNA (cytidine(1402)-2'-O)-methyltransferase [Legionella sp.]|nr:16S rRNA (cytidine(1402)-2'-O)-methyltransferase [Legionella sp.]
MDNSATTSGILYIVATPIGHRDDISLRALNTLKSVDTILAEDTRHSMQLLTLLGIKKPMMSLHAHNESNKSEQIIALLLQGKSLALISDAGTPLISDPGFPLVKLAQSHGITVCPIPGACALIAALSAAGIPCDTFTFSGFLPAKQAARRVMLESFIKTDHTLVFYESTHRILDCVDDISAVFGDACEWVLAKELTKTFERFISGSSATIKAWLLADVGHCKGEFVVMIPPRVVVHDKQSKATDILSILLAELPLKQAVKLACQLTKENKNELYDLALRLQEKK